MTITVHPRQINKLYELFFYEFRANIKAKCKMTLETGNEIVQNFNVRRGNRRRFKANLTASIPSDQKYH